MKKIRNMKKLILCLCVVIIAFGMVTQAKADRFVVCMPGNGENTVLDNVTGLMWKWDVNTIHGYWDQSISFTENFDYAGYQDWRTPTIEEFETLFDAIGNPSVFPSQLYPPFNDIMQYYWTTTPHTLFDTSDSTTFYDDINHEWIWPVRTTQAPVPEPTTMLLLGSGLIGLAGFRRKFKKR